MYNNLNYNPDDKDIYGKTCEYWRIYNLEIYVLRERYKIFRKLRLRCTTTAAPDIFGDDDLISVADSMLPNQIASVLGENSTILSESSGCARASFAPLVVKSKQEQAETASLVPIRLLLMKNTTTMINNTYLNKSSVFTAALGIGNVILEWNESSLVQLTLFTEQESKPVGDIIIAYANKNNNLEKILSDLSEIIGYWNSNMYYDTRVCNAIHFIDACCKNLYVTVTLTGVLAIIYNEILLNGFSKQTLKITRDLIAGGIGDWDFDTSIILSTNIIIDNCIKSAELEFPTLLLHNDTMIILKGLRTEEAQAEEKNDTVEACSSDNNDGTSNLNYHVLNAKRIKLY